jgi:DNA-binding protein YbaB
MADDAFIDIETVQGQAALLAQTRDAIDAIGTVAASSPGDLVRVWVTTSGSVVDIDLDEASRRLDCDELARLITATAQQAAQNAAASIAGVLAELEHRRSLLLDQLSEVDPEVAAALRDAANATQPPPPPA